MRRIGHLDVFIGVVLDIIIGMTGQHQQHNVVIVINVYAKQKHVSNAQSIHIVKVVSIQHVHHVQKKNQQLMVKLEVQCVVFVERVAHQLQEERQETVRSRFKIETIAYEEHSI